MAKKEKVAARTKKYYEDNKEKLAAYQKEWQKENKEKVAVYNKRYREGNKKKLAAHGKRYREANRKKEAARQKRWYEANKDKIAAYYEANKERIAARKRKRLYGITLEEWKTLKAKQNNRCAICGKKKKLHVDHCHIKGRVRGLLCANCNTALGKFQDSLEILERAAQYVSPN